MIFDIQDDISSEIEEISKILGNRLTGKEISSYFSSLGLIDQWGEGWTKYIRIKDAFMYELTQIRDDSKVIAFIERTCKPVNFITPEEHKSFLETLNLVLVFLGYRVDESGKVCKVDKAHTLDEALDRVDRLNSELKKRNIHPLVMNYCSKEYLAKDYFHACFEAIKGIFKRLRDLTGRTEDGRTLIERVFAKGKPLIVINGYSTQTEKDEFIGFSNLLLFLHKSFRNQEAHETRVGHEMTLEEALDVFVCVSLANKYLDRAQPTCFVQL